jgi:PAS domain S-box-containing protein
VRAALQHLPAPGAEGLSLGLRIVRPGGEVRQLHSHTRMEDDGDHRLVFGVLFDITERALSEQALRGAQERIALALRGAGIGTWEMDLQTRAVIWDEQMWRLRGLPPRAQAPTEKELWSWTHPEDRERALQQLQVAEAAAAPLDNEFRILTPDGRERWLATRSAEVRDAGGRRRRIGVNWDVTATRTAEAARREGELARRESQAKSQFLARMSHELRTPLNAVLGFAQLMLAEEPGRDAASATRRRRLDHVQAAGRHLLDLIDDVLTLSGVEGGEMPVAAQPVALAPLLAQVLPMLTPLQAGHQVSVETAVPDGLHVRGDSIRLRQVLLNLLSNAIKYNRPGGRVDVVASAAGGHVRLSVADTGRGMDERQLRHLFEPFNRLGAERSSVQGSGIGLAIVKALVGRMQGSVTVQSSPGAGSVFTIELQLADTAAPAATATAAPLVLPEAAAPAGRHRLLYIEDNPVNALIIAELVARRNDLELHIAADGLTGLAQARALQPGLLLLDMQLPDIDGLEVLARLRADPATAAIPVIALSANAMPDDVDRALAAGCSAYWTKPLDFRAFMAGLESLFGQPRA